MYTCNRNQTPWHYFEYAYDFIILKMNTVTIQYFSDFHTRIVYGFVFALVCEATIG